MPEIQTPIISGFHPDPSICRVGDDYYIANSSFEWFSACRFIIRVIGLIGGMHTIANFDYFDYRPEKS